MFRKAYRFAKIKQLLSKVRRIITVMTAGVMWPYNDQ